MDSVAHPVQGLSTLTGVPLGRGSNPGEGMDVCKCIVLSRQGGTLNSRRAASPFVRLVEGEERLQVTTGVTKPLAMLNFVGFDLAFADQLRFVFWHMIPIWKSSDVEMTVENAMPRERTFLWLKKYPVDMATVELFAEKVGS
ncbi:hypothetical protein TNCV_1375821 [Trichonephila clavipes]|nr:hypothetical protein TNCV_1375821 [Trichonephila clavipes]